MAKILLIEPDAILAKTYKSALLTAGHKVYLVSGAQAAITAADKRNPELIIMEVQLAGHNGLEFLYEFRSYSEWQKIPVLLHTFLPPAEFSQNSLAWDQVGVCGYMYKPRTSLRQLLSSVAAYNLEHESA